MSTKNENFSKKCKIKGKNALLHKISVRSLTTRFDAKLFVGFMDGLRLPYRGAKIFGRGVFASHRGGIVKWIVSPKM